MNSLISHLSLLASGASTLFKRTARTRYAISSLLRIAPLPYRVASLIAFSLRRAARGSILCLEVDTDIAQEVLELRACVVPFQTGEVQATGERQGYHVPH